MKQPTLKQLRKRPALWVNENFYTVRISYPDGKVEYYHDEVGMWKKSFYSKSVWYLESAESGFLKLRRDNTFLGWL